MKTERPTDEELKELIEVYGPPSFKKRQVYLNSLDYDIEEVDSKGEVIVEIKKDEKIAGVRSKDEKRYVLPQGKVLANEDFIEGTKRVVFEKTHFRINIIRLKEIRRIQIKFSDELVERWYFLFETELRGSDSEQKDVKFLDEVPQEEPLNSKRVRRRSE